MLSAIRAHPWLTAAFVGGTAFGAVAGLWLIEPEVLSVWRRLLAGALSGTICVLIVTANRILDSGSQEE